MAIFTGDSINLSLDIWHRRDPFVHLVSSSSLTPAPTPDDVSMMPVIYPPPPPVSSSIDGGGSNSASPLPGFYMPIHQVLGLGSTMYHHQDYHHKSSPLRGGSAGAGEGGPLTPYATAGATTAAFDKIRANSHDATAAAQAKKGKRVVSTLNLKARHSSEPAPKPAAVGHGQASSAADSARHSRKLEYQRAKIACVNCRRRKIRCKHNHGNPPCAQCRRLGRECVFEPVNESPAGAPHQQQQQQQQQQRQGQNKARHLSLSGSAESSSSTLSSKRSNASQSPTVRPSETILNGGGSGDGGDGGGDGSPSGSSKRKKRVLPTPQRRGILPSQGIPQVFGANIAVAAGMAMNSGMGLGLGSYSPEDKINPQSASSASPHHFDFNQPAHFPTDWMAAAAGSVSPTTTATTASTTTATSAGAFETDPCGASPTFSPFSPHAPAPTTAWPPNSIPPPLPPPRDYAWSVGYHHHHQHQQHQHQQPPRSLSFGGESASHRGAATGHQPLHHHHHGSLTPYNGMVPLPPILGSVGDGVTPAASSTTTTPHLANDLFVSAQQQQVAAAEAEGMAGGMMEVRQVGGFMTWQLAAYEAEDGTTAYYGEAEGAGLDAEADEDGAGIDAQVSGGGMY